MIRKTLAAAAIAAGALALSACGTAAPADPVQQKAGATGFPTTPNSPRPTGTLSAVDTGYGIARSHDPSLSDFAWAASTVRNTTANVVAFTASFSAYAGGTVVGQSSGTGIVRAGATTAIGTQIELPSGTKVSRVVVTLSTVDSERDAHPTSRFDAVGVHYQPGEFGQSKVLGEVRSRYTQDVTNVQVEVVCYGANGKINGGGEAYVDAIGSGQTVGFSVDLLTVSGAPSRCAAYPMVSAISEGS